MRPVPFLTITLSSGLRVSAQLRELAWEAQTPGQFVHWKAGSEAGRYSQELNSDRTPVSSALTSTFTVLMFMAWNGEKKELKFTILIKGIKCVI